MCLHRSVQRAGIRADAQGEELLVNLEMSRKEECEGPRTGRSQKGVQTCTLQALLPGSAGSLHPSGFTPSTMQPHWDQQA